jgi:hypothetical protein
MPRPGTPVIHPSMLDTVTGWAARGRIDECVITREGPAVWDPDTNVDTAATATVYEGSILIQDVRPSSESRSQPFGDQPVVTSSYFASIDAAAADIHVEDIVTVTASADPDLLGRTLRVTEVRLDSFHVRRRLLLEETTTPTGG